MGDVMGEWTEERVTIVRARWASGVSAGLISQELGGVTRNAVIGKIHRLGLQRRCSPNRPVKRAPRIKRESLSHAPRYSPPAPASAPTPPPSLNIPLLKLTRRQCHWITDDTRPEQRYCGHEAAGGSAYCAAHLARLNTPQKGKWRGA